MRWSSVMSLDEGHRLSKDDSESHEAHWLSRLHSFNLVEKYSLHNPLGQPNGNPLQYSCLENPVDRGAWWATVHGVARVRQETMQEQLNTTTRK